MGVILPALSLALVHIAGDTVAVVPAMASVLGRGIYPTVFFAYIVFGSMTAGLSAWIGVKSGRELTAVVKRLFGTRGRRVQALAVLAVSLPASALTGGYFAGQLLQQLTGAGYVLTAPSCIIVCCLLAAGYAQELLRFSNYLALLILPAIGIMLFALVDTMPLAIELNLLSLEYISWPLVLALIGYNAGGMRSALVVEAGTYLADKRYTGIYLVILAKCFEGLFTLLLAHIALISGAGGCMPLLAAASQIFSPWIVVVFNCILLCILVNTMVPAMLVNAKQLSIITNLPGKTGLTLAGVLVWGGSFISLDIILMLMSAAGLFMVLFIGWLAYSLHKRGNNKLQ